MTPTAKRRLNSAVCGHVKWKVLVVLSLFVLVCLLLNLRSTSRIFVELRRKQRLNVTVESSRCLSQTEILQPIPNGNALVVSAYLDSRLEPGSVRVLAIVKRSPPLELHCYFACRNGLFVVASPAEVNLFHDHFGFPWAGAHILCSLHDSPCAKPDKVALVPTERSDGLCFVANIQNAAPPQPEDSFTHDFGVCISTLFGGYNNVLQFTQAMEMYRLLGAGRVTIYNSSCGAELGRVLAHYAATGLLEVIPWPIDRHLTPSTGWTYPTHPGDVHYYGQTAALNDCLYRHMYDTRYLVMNDVDEIIIPVDCASWACLMMHLNGIYDADVYRFNNHVFPYTVVDDFGRVFDRWKGIPGRNILTQVRREPNPFFVFNPTKMILNPRQVVETSVHHVVSTFGKRALVSSSLAKLHHYRSPERPNINKRDLIIDPVMWKYKAALVSNVNSVLHKVGLLR
ncbi:unnamed protein product [Lampetra planeri]